ncbi:hypothetical protein EV14_0242 [Prochlorococcus sp. MIT 0703]|nr:hypothetical protein EV12_1312 [Prochlorococcus sp. MIT 0701]KGG36510.1 hypothetical protein EV14_0242 [Prochlorococcus sp. MIT 0703]
MPTSSLQQGKANISEHNAGRFQDTPKLLYLACIENNKAS